MVPSKVRAELVKLENLGPTWVFCVSVRVYIMTLQLASEFTLRSDKHSTKEGESVIHEAIINLVELRKSVFRWLTAWSSSKSARQIPEVLAHVSGFHQSHVLSRLGYVYACTDKSYRYYRVLSFLDCVGERLFEDHSSAYVRAFKQLTSPFYVAEAYILWANWVTTMVIEQKSFLSMVYTAKNMISANHQLCDDEKICGNPRHTSFLDPCDCLRAKIFNNYGKWIFAYVHVWITGTLTPGPKWHYALSIPTTCIDGAVVTDRFDGLMVVNRIIPELAEQPVWANPCTRTARIEFTRFRCNFMSPIGAVPTEVQITPHDPTLLPDAKTVFIEVEASGRKRYVALSKGSKPLPYIFARATHRYKHNEYRGVAGSASASGGSSLRASSVSGKARRKA